MKLGVILSLVPLKKKKGYVQAVVDSHGKQSFKQSGAVVA